MLGFKLSNLVSGPLDGVLYDRGERLKGAKRDLLFRGVPLGGKRKAILAQSKKKQKETTTNMAMVLDFSTDSHGYYRTLSSLAQ